MNDKRRRLGTKTLPLVEEMASESIARFDGKLAVASGEIINRGITGIMANRLVERLNIPVMVVHFGSEIIIGSIRSPGNYDIRLLLEPIEDILLNWGGHTNALGFSLSRSLWEQFIDRLEIEVCYIDCADLSANEGIIVDAELPKSYITSDILTVVDQFEPYGADNEPLVFVSCGLKVIASVLIGKNNPKHLKMTVDTGKCQWPAILWNVKDNIETEIKAGDTVDMVYIFNRDAYRKSETPQMVVRGLRKSGVSKNV
jgi:single-stranded-DNA-specific exonuclease